MNNETHQTWHPGPGDTTEALAASIDRVRRAHGITRTDRRHTMTHETPGAGPEQDAINDVKAVADEFGLTFQLSDPDSTVTVEQRTINNMLFALAEARHELAESAPLAEISAICDACGGQWFWPVDNGYELHLSSCHEHSDPPEAPPVAVTEALQERVGAWGEVTFPKSTPLSIATHLRDEADELREAVAWGDNVAEEAADVYLLLLHLAHRCGFDLLEAAEAKFAVVQTRTYTTDSGRGYTRHDAKGGEG